MMYLVLKAAISGVLIALASTFAKRFPGVGFWVALAAGCALTILLYAKMTWLGPRFGLQL